jgi:hypothetical protein
LRGTRLPRTGSHQHSRRPSGLGQRAHLDTPMGFFLGSRIHSPAPHGGGPVPARRLAVCHPGGGKRQKPVLSRPSTGRWIGILGQAVSGARRRVACTCTQLQQFADILAFSCLHSDFTHLER